MGGDGGSIVCGLLVLSSDRPGTSRTRSNVYSQPPPPVHGTCPQAMALSMAALVQDFRRTRFFMGLCEAP